MLPDAELKLYLEVSLEERARRRAADRQLDPASAEAEAILEDLRRRDHLDSSRAVAPLRVPEDAVVIRSDGRERERTVDEVVRIVRTGEVGASPGGDPAGGDPAGGDPDDRPRHRLARFRILLEWFGEHLPPGPS